ncbi:hypothetical protein [Chryseobacterium gregarium]|uniref:hypothetical protein n=1 Tax=Chryseobacterium gregarium TaxID=456299 RepID=UPI0004296330|nr:hypothetical protein [Chryseobacterium gregarium]
MDNIISYNYPFDSLENQQIINLYRDIKVSSGLSGSKIDFDTRRGSFLSLADHDFINFSFDVFKIGSDKSYVINVFFNYETLSEGNAYDPFIRIDDQYSLSIRDNILFINADHSEKLTPDTWYNMTVTIKRDRIKTFLFDKEIGSAAISSESVREIKLQGGKASDIKFSDLSIQEEVNASALDKIRNYQNLNNLSVFSPIHFRLYNRADYKDRLFLEDGGLSLFLDIDFGKYLVEFDSGKDVHLLLKAKKGFFKLKQGLPYPETVTAEGDDFCIPLKTDSMQVKDHRLTVPISYVELVNLRNQDQLLVQLELTNCILKTEDHGNTLLSGDHSVTIDQTIAIQDNLGAGGCPFDVFVFGNDTLYNGSDNEVQTIILRVINNAGESMAFGQNSSFEITSSQIEIIRPDVWQAANMKIKNRNGTELNTRKDEKLKVFFAQDAAIAENQWIDIEVSGIQAKAASPEFPSGSYPFYLEYRNIPGYRSGKTRFYIRTGKIFYSN